MTAVASLLIAVLLQSATPPGRTLEAGIQASVDESVRAVIRNQDEWNTFWRKQMPNRPVPPVDFAREMVVAVFLGSRPTAGYSVEIVSARDEQGALVVRFREHKPPADAMTAQMITSPFHIVAVPKVAGVPRYVSEPN